MSDANERHEPQAGPIEGQPRDAGPLDGATPVAPRRWSMRMVALWALGAVAGAAFLLSGVLLLLVLNLTPNPGLDAILLILKVADLAGWVVIGRWLLGDWSQRRLRVVAVPIAGWSWTYLMAALIANFSFLNWGY